MKITENIKNIAIIVLLIMLGFGAYQYFNNNSKWSNKYDLQVNLTKAVTDTLHQTTDALGRVTSEKLTLQASNKDLKDKVGVLTENQKELLAEVKAANKKNDIITAALIKERVKVDSLGALLATKIDTTNNTISFNDSTKDVKYNMTVTNVKQAEPEKPTNLLINDLEFPNSKFVKFNWGDKKEGYPISFSVTNSNHYFQTQNIDSYAIPELQKQEVKPTGWKKIGNFFKKAGKDILIFGSGVATGLLIMTAAGK